jgi:hypothetical protein
VSKQHLGLVSFSQQSFGSRVLKTGATVRDELISIHNDYCKANP